MILIICFGDGGKFNVRAITYVLEGRDLQAMSDNKYMHVGDLNFSQVIYFLSNYRTYHFHHLPADTSWLVRLCPT